MARMAPQSLEFTGFGPSFLHRGLFALSGSADLRSDRVESRKLVRASVPQAPGVYGWIGEDGRLIYVGKSKSLRHRLVSYFAANTADPKMERIRNAAQRIVWQPVGHELLALLREQELIHRWRPEYNSMGQPNRRLPAFVALSDSAAPHVFLAKRLTTRTLRAFGPIVGTAELGESVAALNHVFQLRDCSDRTGFSFGEQPPLFADLGERALCLRHELGSCPAPCAGFCSRRGYQQRVEGAIAFLEGRDPRTVPDLERKMLVSAAAMQFERAAIHHQHGEALGRLQRQLERLRTAERRIHGVLTVAASPRRNLLLVFARGRLVNGFPVPRNPDRRQELARSLGQAASRPAIASDDTLSVNLQMIVGSWFRKHFDLLNQLQPLERVAEMLGSPAIRRSA